MAKVQDFSTMFKDENFVKSYKLAEKATAPFGSDLIDHCGIVAEAKSNPEKPLVILDNACGTGVITRMLNERLDAQTKSKWKITCGDFSEAMIEYTKREALKEGWPNVETKIVDAQDTGLPSDYYTHVITAFAFMALPKSLVALDDTKRILQPGGHIAISTWINPAWLHHVTGALANAPGNLTWPTAEEFLGSMTDGQWASVSWIDAQLRDRGFQDVDVKPVTKYISLTVSEFLPMLSKMLPMVANRFWTEEQREQGLPTLVPIVEKYLVDKYGPEGDIGGDWTAIVATGRKA